MYNRKLFIEVDLRTENTLRHDDVEVALHEMIVEVTKKIRDVKDDASSGISIKYDIWTNPEN